MGRERLEFGVRVRKLMVISVKACYRSVWNHPFLVVLVCFLAFLYRSFPFLFSILVTACPVLVCTAVLLGILLIFGSPNIPEIDKKEEEEEKVSHEVSQLKIGATEDHTVVERYVHDDDFVVERHVGKRWEMVENDDEKANLINNEVSEVEEADGSVCYKPLVGKDLDSRDIHCENGVIDEVEGTLNDSLVEKKREILEEMIGIDAVSSMEVAADDQHVLADEVGDRNLGVEDGKPKADFSDIARGDELNSSLVSSWKRAADHDDDESLDSGSDGAESSSPDASMADIIPMLDELHPLLGSEAPQPAQLSHDGSDAASEGSYGSNNDESFESYESENQGEEDHDDEEDEVEGEGAKGDQEDESKSAIKWTEDDQKNLMDLGTSELERNQRLENLIARRRVRKNMRLMAEKNLIDLDSAEIPLNIAPISTTRRNPFELPYDSYNDLGLPSIPGSAPSILQPGKNPFDLPYDSSEEKPDLKGDGFQEEFSGFNQREAVFQRGAFFRRHESFNVGPSSLGVPRQELKWKPYFVPEQLITEGAIPSSFQRQSSEVSESKLSSVHDTESVSSVVDEEDNKSYSQETDLIMNEDHASIHDEQESLSSGDVESVDVEQAENRDVHHDVVEITLGDGESQLEMESNLSQAVAPAHLELYASEIESTSHVGQAENRDVRHDVVEITSGYGESQLEMESNLSEADATTHVELNASEIHPRTEPVQEEYSSRSSLSSLSEIDEKISDVREGSAGFGPQDHEIKESDISTQPSFEESKFHLTSRVVDNNQHNEPVYDSSPPSTKKLLSFSSVSSDTQVEISEMGSPSMLVESTDKEVEGHGETAAQGGVLYSSPEEKQHPMQPREFSEAEPGDRHAVDKEDAQLEQDEIHSSSSSEENIVEGSVMPKEEIVQIEFDQMHSSNFDASLDVDGHHDKDEELSSVDLTYQHMPSKLQSSSTAEESDHIVVARVSKVDPSEANLKEVHQKESEMDEVQSPCSDSKIDDGLYHEVNVEGAPSNSSYQVMPSRENPSPELEKQLSQSDKSMDDPPIDKHDKLEEPSIIATESRGEVDIVNNDNNVHKVHESEDKLSTNFSSMTSERTSSPAESPEHTLPTDREDLKDKILNEIESEGFKEVYATHVDEESISEEEDEIKEIDEGILSELDTVRDFNVKEIGLSEGSHVARTESALLPEDKKTETDVELPVLEARSAEDIDLAFEQLHEGVDFEEVILPSMIENQHDHAGTNSKLPVVEARSLEDIHNAFQQCPESNPAELPHSSDLRNGSSEVERRDVVSAKEIEVSNSVSGIQENSENAASEPKNQHEEASEKSSLNLKGKKAKSHDSSSSSSSSSSDSE